MNVKVLFVSARSATVELEDCGLYALPSPYRLTLNGEDAGMAETVVFSLYDLKPQTDYALRVLAGKQLVGEAFFRTETESFTLDVRRFGAVGDGKHEDGAAIQAAICCCPSYGRVLIPAGQYQVGPLFLKSHVRLEVQRGATLMLETKRCRFPVLPAVTRSTDETRELHLASWEGKPADMLGALLMGVGVEDVLVYGQGTLDGQAEAAAWRTDGDTAREASRPRLLFLNRCRSVTVQGLSFRNGPAWQVHSYFSSGLKFFNIQLTAPTDGPDTAGFVPECCQDVLISGARFSLGDDCVSIQAGKPCQDKAYQRSCEQVEISHCLMENGQSGLNCGSETAGKIHHVHLHDCLMRHTQRGLRVRTRRDQGEGVHQGKVDQVLFECVKMEQVGTPCVINGLYSRAPEEESGQEKPQDEDKAPKIGSVIFRNVEAEDAACAGYLLGQPEKPVGQVTLEHVRVSCGANAAPMRPAMAEGVPVCARTGLVAANVEKLILKDVRITGQEGVWLACDGVGEVEQE